MTRKGLPSLREPYSQAQSSRVAVLIERAGEANGHGSSRIGGLAEPFLRGIACSCPIDVMFRFPAGWGQRRRTPARTDLGAEVDRFRGGSGPISRRNRTDLDEGGGLVDAGTRTSTPQRPSDRTGRCFSIATARIRPRGRRARCTTMISPVLSHGSRSGTERSNLPGAYREITSMTEGSTGR